MEAVPTMKMSTMMMSLKKTVRKTKRKVHLPQVQQPKLRTLTPEGPQLQQQ
jgi:hypothetical protein